MMSKSPHFELKQLQTQDTESEDGDCSQDGSSIASQTPRQPVGRHAQDAGRGEAVQAAKRIAAPQQAAGAGSEAGDVWNDVQPQASISSLATAAIASGARWHERAAKFEALASHMQHATPHVHMEFAADAERVLGALSAGIGALDAFPILLFTSDPILDRTPKSINQSYVLTNSFCSALQAIRIAAWPLQHCRRCQWCCNLHAWRRCLVGWIAWCLGSSSACWTRLSRWGDVVMFMHVGASRCPSRPWLFP